MSGLVLERATVDEAGLVYRLAKAVISSQGVESFNDVNRVIDVLGLGVEVYLVVERERRLAS